MSKVYSTYEAKSRFSEIIRQVRGGQVARVSYHGREVAEIRPVSIVDPQTASTTASMAPGDLSLIDERFLLTRDK